MASGAVAPAEGVDSVVVILGSGKALAWWLVDLLAPVAAMGDGSCFGNGSAFGWFATSRIVTASAAVVAFVGGTSLEGSSCYEGGCSLKSSCCFGAGSYFWGGFCFDGGNLARHFAASVGLPQAWYSSTRVGTMLRQTLGSIPRRPLATADSTWSNNSSARA